MAGRPILHLRFRQPVDPAVDGDDRPPRVPRGPAVRVRRPMVAPKS